MEESELLKGNQLIADIFCDKLPGTGEIYNLPGEIGSPFIIKMATFHKSWDRQTPVWSKIAHIYRDLDKTQEHHMTYIRYCDKYANAVFTNNTQDGFKIIVKMIEEINKSKQNT